VRNNDHVSNILVRCTDYGRAWVCFGVSPFRGERHEVLVTQRLVYLVSQAARAGVKLVKRRGLALPKACKCPSNSAPQNISSCGKLSSQQSEPTLPKSCAMKAGSELTWSLVNAFLHRPNRSSHDANLQPLCLITEAAPTLRKKSSTTQLHSNNTLPATKSC
jgi:hypothetical protein